MSLLFKPTVISNRIFSRGTIVDSAQPSISDDIILNTPPPIAIPIVRKKYERPFFTRKRNNTAYFPSF